MWRNFYNESTWGSLLKRGRGEKRGVMAATGGVVATTIPAEVVPNDGERATVVGGTDASVVAEAKEKKVRL